MRKIMQSMILDLTPPASTTDEHSRRDELAERLRWLINLRWVALAFVTIAVLVARQLDYITSAWPLAAVTAVMALLNLGFHGLHLRIQVRTLRALSAEALFQIATDVIGLGLLMLFSGALSNPFMFYFIFHVVIAGILLERRQAYFVALMTAGIVALLALAEHTGWNDRWKLANVMTALEHTPQARFAFVAAFGSTLIILVYMVTAIVERLRSHSRDVRRLNADLAERVSMLGAAEKKLAAEHQRARAILECMDEGVVVVDLQGKVMLANTAAQQSALLALEDTLRKAGCDDAARENCTRDEDCRDEKDNADCPIGSPAECLQDALNKGGKLCPATLALLGADPPPPEPIDRLSAPKSPKLAQIQLKDRSFENTVSSVRTASGDIVGIVVVSRDVTERNSLQRQVFHAEKLTALGNLAAGVAHELNTPLGTILGYAQMMLEDEQPQPPRELKAIEDQARRCRKIVQGLLDFARKSGGGRDSFAPNDVLVKIRDLMGHSLEMRGVALRVDLAEPAPPRIVAAVNEVEQVLVNLITNAADAVEASGNWSTKTVTLQSRAEPNGSVLIAVEDDGPGIPQSIADQIFEPFFTTKAAGRGTGLGLSIARRIVEDHGGELKLTRRLDEKSGARFELRLPAAHKKAEAPAELATAR